MTIQFQGHVQAVSSEGSTPGRVEVHIVTDHTVCPKEIFVNVPQEDVAHWLVGRTVSITMYAYDYFKKPSELREPASVSSASEEGSK